MASFDFAQVEIGLPKSECIQGQARITEFRGQLIYPPCSAPGLQSYSFTPSDSCKLFILWNDFKNNTRKFSFLLLYVCMLTLPVCLRTITLSVFPSHFDFSDTQFPSSIFKMGISAGFPLPCYRTRAAKRAAHYLQVTESELNAAEGLIFLFILSTDGPLKI